MEKLRKVERNAKYIWLFQVTRHHIWHNNKGISQPLRQRAEQEGVLERVADYLARLSATGTVVALVMGAARGAHMLFLGERGYLVRLLFPLAEPSVFVL